MKIKCKEVTGYLFSRKSVREGITNITTYDALTKEKIYTVYGIILVEESLEYLIYDDYDLPSWYEADLFEVEDSTLPKNWHYSFLGYDECPITAIWGYYQLAHFDGLAEHEVEDVILFLRYKKTIDKKI